ncbi:hypothetical protein Q9306_17990 [Bacillus sp. WLY-B-L8]|nr:hypothetical protein [Bacillus sp. WLY-B-L8]
MGRLSPGNHEGTGKKITLTMKGKSHTKLTFWVVSQTSHTWSAARNWLLAVYRGKKKALLAIAHKMIKIVHHILEQ